MKQPKPFYNNKLSQQPCALDRQCSCYVFQKEKRWRGGHPAQGPGKPPSFVSKVTAMGARAH